MQDKAKRSRYKPKQKYFQESKADNPKIPCPKCLESGVTNYLSRSEKRFRSPEDTNKIERICPVLFCVFCDYVERQEEEIKKIPK